MNPLSRLPRAAFGFATILLLSCAAVATSAVASSNTSAGKPNLIFILADDLGYGEIGCYGQKAIQTPSIDRMAKEGLRFTQFYSGATVCAPSRSVLMTGQHHGRTRVRGNSGRDNPEAQALQPGDITVAKVLQESGYRTALIGKWGLGDVGAAAAGLPRKHGFDFFFGYLNQTHAHNHYPAFLWRNEEKVALPNDIIAKGDLGAGWSENPKVYSDDLFADEAIRFVTENRARPFFLFWSMVVPHANNERGRALGNGTEVPELGIYANRDWPAQDKGHAAMITRMDGYVGRMLDTLRKLGIANNTLVIFASDNGPHNEAKHDLSRFAPSGPFSGIKRSLTDGGIRVPFIAWWPGRVPTDVASGHVGYFGDWMATAAELAGAKAPAGLDSLSLVPTLTGKTGAAQPTHEFLYWEFHEGGFKQAALYQGRWKGIRAGGPNAHIALYDLRNDIAEKTDVSARNPEIVGKIDAYLKTTRKPLAAWEPRWTPAKKANNK